MAGGKYRYLFKNMGLLTLSSFATKLLSFFLVPLYTSVLTTGEYGEYDLFNSTVGVLLPILTFNVQEGVLRFALEKDFDRSALVTVGLRYTLIGTGAVSAGLFGLVVSGAFPWESNYALYFLLMFLSQAFTGFVTYYARGAGRIQELAISSVIASAVTIALNIILLLPLHMGLDGYFLANVVGPLVQSLYLAVVSGMPGATHLTEGYRKQTNEMLSYSKPLIANSIAWWVNNVSDRYIVVFFCGIAANGVYSVAGKIPSILNILQSIFSQAWTLSSVKDFDPEDKDGFFAKTYASYSCLMAIVCSAIIVADKPLASFLYANDFYAAWQYVPWLTIAILFGALSGYLGGFFTAVKDSKEFARSTAIGATINVVLNLISVPFIGPLGAAIATATCYAAVWCIRFAHSRRYIRLRVNLKRDLTVYFVLVVQSIALLIMSDSRALYGVLMAAFVIVVLLHREEIGLVIQKILGTTQG